MSTSPPTNNDALLGQNLATKVLGIPELAETILLNLPMKDLLFAQLICKDIKNLIDSSKPIQGALFFLPGEAKSAHFDSKHMSAPFNWLHEGEDRGFPSEGGVFVNPLLCRYRYLKPRYYEPSWHEFKVHQRALDAICSAARRAERDDSIKSSRHARRCISHSLQSRLTLTVQLCTTRSNSSRTWSVCVVVHWGPWWTGCCFMASRRRAF